MDMQTLVRGPVMADVAAFELTDVEKARLMRPEIGGVILFRRNFESVAQLKALVAEIKALRTPELVIAVDHEGGRVQRFIQGFTRLPAMAVLNDVWQTQGKDAALAQAEEIGWVLAAELRACGIDLSFTPVLDLDWDQCAVIGNRSFSADAQEVSDLALALQSGLKRGGMNSCSETRWYKLAPLWLLGVVLCFEPIVFRQNATEGGSSYWMVYFGISALIVAAILWGRKRIAERLPSFEVLDDVMYKSIAVGFAFFTIATVLGALWAAEAWGGYWSWDPKETWALIVWLNYASWLHMRLMKGLRGAMSAWWALVGLVVTTFAFLGVNMFLSGLHSYGTL
jgi:hypothetical protein